MKDGARICTAEYRSIDGVELRRGDMFVVAKLRGSHRFAIITTEGSTGGVPARLVRGISYPTTVREWARAEMNDETPRCVHSGIRRR